MRATDHHLDEIDVSILARLAKGGRGWFGIGALATALAGSGASYSAMHLAIDHLADEFPAQLPRRARAGVASDAVLVDPVRLRARWPDLPDAEPLEIRPWGRPRSSTESAGIPARMEPST